MSGGEIWVVTEQTRLKYMYVSMSTGTSIVCPRKSPQSIPLTHPARERAREGKAHGFPLGISKTVTGWLVGWFASIWGRRLRAGFAICVCNIIPKKNTSQDGSLSPVRQISEVFLLCMSEKNMALCSAEMADAFSWSGGGGSENRARLFEGCSRRK